MKKKRQRNLLKRFRICLAGSDHEFDRGLRLISRRLRIPLSADYIMSLLDKILGRPLRSSEAAKEELGVLTGVPVLGLDALSSTAYGPEAALTILVAAGALGLNYLPLITIVILALLGMLYVSYRQTIAAYPNGGGAYVVAKENLGTRPGLLAAAALLLDYMLNVAVGISAGVAALVSALPRLQQNTLGLCLLVLLLLTIVNLRGVR